MTILLQLFMPKKYQPFMYITLFCSEMPETPPTPAVLEPAYFGLQASKPTNRKNNEGVYMTVDERTLLSMPEFDYMNAEQLAFFRRCLEDLRDDLLNNFTQTTRHLQETE
jgi:hypothetical protein